MHLNYAEVKKRLVDFIRRETARAGFKKAILGLSGGLDSAVTCYLTAEALGAENVHALILPYRTSNPQSSRDAWDVVEKTGVKGQEIEITPQIDAYFEQLSGEAARPDKIRRGNKMARERMAVIYDLSKFYHALVVGTSNKTETLLGYSTLWGDMAAAITPIGDLYKTQVRGLAEELGVPSQIIVKSPSADLWEGQTDEGELGFTYQKVDRLLYAYFELGESLKELEKRGFEREFISKVLARVRYYEFKRRLPVTPAINQVFLAENS